MPVAFAGTAGPGLLPGARVALSRLLDHPSRRGPGPGQRGAGPRASGSPCGLVAASRPFRSTRLPLPEHRTFAEGEWRAAMLGALQGLDVRWVNHPFAADAAAPRPWQLSLARQAGLQIREPW